MRAAKKRHEWAKFLTFFNEQNAHRPTRLGVFERKSDVVNDYWLENGLPLIRLDLDAEGELPSVKILVGDLNHEINDAVKLLFHFNLAGDEDGLDILCADGRTIILRFENRDQDQ